MCSVDFENAAYMIVASFARTYCFHYMYPHSAAYSIFLCTAKQKCKKNENKINKIAHNVHCSFRDAYPNNRQENRRKFRNIIVLLVFCCCCCCYHVLVTYLDVFFPFFVHIHIFLRKHTGYVYIITTTTYLIQKYQ